VDREPRVAQTKALMSWVRLPAGTGVHESVTANQPLQGDGQKQAAAERQRLARKARRGADQSLSADR